MEQEVGIRLVALLSLALRRHFLVSPAHCLEKIFPEAEDRFPEGWLWS
jgi:hypothetical protein